jgi:hypothetical protein
MFTVKMNTAVAVAWIVDENGNTYEMSQDLADLRRKVAQINDRIRKNQINERDAIMLEMFQAIVDAPSPIPRVRDASISAIRVINKRMLDNA